MTSVPISCRVQNRLRPAFGAVEHHVQHVAVGKGRLGSQRYHSLIRRPGFDQHSDIAASAGERAPSLSVIRTKLDRLVEGGDRFCDSLLCPQGAPQVAIRLHKTRCDCDGLFEACNSLSQPSPPPKDIAGVQMGLGMAGVNADRFQKRPEGVIAPAGPRKQKSQIVAIVRHFGSGLNGGVPGIQSREREPD